MRDGGGGANISIEEIDVRRGGGAWKKNPAIVKGLVGKHALGLMRFLKAIRWGRKPRGRSI